jgi:hypothetical protein
MLPPISCLEPNELNKKNTPKKRCKRTFSHNKSCIDTLASYTQFQKRRIYINMWKRSPNGSISQKLSNV